MTGPGFKPGEGRFALSLVGSIPTHLRQGTIKGEEDAGFITCEKPAFFTDSLPYPHSNSKLFVNLSMLAKIKFTSEILIDPH